ncbi:HEAT repeat-containing protein 1 homolog [Leguminivora glycinivorella]|uniref:HEAT repeat-containing protein 1 homolog n=1 Tax=Leguminivora glycinivorella TaxID=1035111 RepID=UPI00200F677C|nr:HEAT repeat-containing protein 1 homolog [Leguminivora glycinivorella]
MATTSLAEQLQKLAAPQTDVYKEDKKKASLLFDPNDAALKDRNIFYELGLSGLQELISLNAKFETFEETLFNKSSLDFERAVESQEVNKNLDANIEKFLIELSPYLQLQSAHKALEWLVNRYSIHQYNALAVLALILPYHETLIFVRIVQILKIDSVSILVRNLLRNVQKTGAPLSKQALYKECVSNPALLGFICENTYKAVQEFGERATQLNTVYAFWCSTVIGIINSAKKVTELMLPHIMKTIMPGLDSSIPDFKSSCLVVLGFLSTKTTFKLTTLIKIVDKLLNSDLSYDTVLLINLMYNNQQNSGMSLLLDPILYSLSNDIVGTLCKHLKRLIESKIKVHRFVCAFLSSTVNQLLKNTEEFMLYSEMPLILLDSLDLTNQNPEKIIEIAIMSYKEPKQESMKVDDDITMVDESSFSFKLLNWYSHFLKSIERKYPEHFDKVVKHQLSLVDKNSVKMNRKLIKVLGFNPAVAHEIGGTFLFENLTHINPERRIQAMEYIGKEFKHLITESKEFVKDALMDRLHDLNSKVVAAVLKIPTENLNAVFDATELTDAFTSILEQARHNSWKPVIRDAIMRLCELDALPVNQATVVALMPYLFPYDEDSAKVTWQILTSSWGKRFELTKDLQLKKSYSDNCGVLIQLVYNELFVKRSTKFDFLDPLQLNKKNILDISIYLLLKSCSFETMTAQEFSDILALVLESIQGREIVPVTKGEFFSVEMIPSFIKVSHQNKIVFEVMEYIFGRMIDGMEIKIMSKPWCDLCKDPNTILIRRLYEIFITGCSLEGYSHNYSKLLQKLLDKSFSDPKEKFEFIVNFGCGHILYANDPNDVINPELQLKSLKLLYTFIQMQQNENWLYDSDVIMLMIIFNLNNPISVIRSYTVDMIELLLKTKSHKNQIYVQLMKGLHDHREELIMDPEQISQVLDTLLTQSADKIFRKKCLDKLLGIVVKDTPAHVSSELLKIMANINNIQAFSIIIPAFNMFELILKLNKDNPKFTFDVYESKIFRNICSRINSATISTLSKQTFWDPVAFALREYRECIMEEDQTFRSPCVLIMKQLDEESFKKVPEERIKDLVNLIAAAGTFSNNPLISSAAAKVVRKIHLNFADFQPILEKMLNAADPGAVSQKKKTASVSMISYRLTETEEWRLGVTMLEYVQNKKRMTVDNTFVTTLFQVLNKCLRFEEQSYVEYPKQLVLSSLFYYCKKFVDDTDKDQLKSLKSMFDIELVVQCIRGTQNPQTHHHALILLTHAAYMLPEQVLHHTMEIFTFMGSSVLRHDDAYSFQIIIKIIETLIPILVKLDRPVEEYSEKELQQLQKRVVPVLRIFADVVLHVPEHRRLPLYKKLMETIGPNQFLWTFLALLLETHVAHFNEEKEKADKRPKSLAERESPMNRLDFGQNLLLEFSPEICMETFIKLMAYAKTLPLQKDENAMDTNVDPTEIFSVNGHRPNQLRHYKYIIITFMNSFLASSRFIHHSRQATDIKTMETHYKTFIINVLTFIQSITKITDEKTVKYYRVMLHHSYDLLDHTNNLLSPPMFLSVVRGLLKHTLQTVRRKSMELLNNKIQHNAEMFKGVSKDLVYSLLPALVDIVKTIDVTNEEGNKLVAQDMELNQQTALLSLKLLARMLAETEPEEFGSVLETVTEYTCRPNISSNVMASVVLTLAELCANMKAYALQYLHKFMPALIKVLKLQRKAETPELVLLSTVTSLAKIIESLPLFLSPYLQKILYEYAILLAKWQSFDQECAKVSAIVTKLMAVKKKIASSIPPRVLIPVANANYQLLLDKEKYDAVGPVMAVLAESFANITSSDFTALQQDLTALFLAALQLRSDSVDKADDSTIDSAEEEVVNALVSLVLKLSETSFRPFYFKIYDWAIRTNVEGQRDRAITFYRVSSAIADKLKGLFVLFAGHFIKNAAELLDSCNKSKTEDLYFDSEEKCITLINYIIKTLHIVFLYDSQNFLNKDRFETLMQPVVDQLENDLGGIVSLKERAGEWLVPCVAQFAVATADDSLWKLLNYQVLLKTRHNDAEIRLLALDCLVAMATQLGSSWLPLLAESVPFLAELLEDGDPKIETTTKDAIRKLETILGEPLEKYF